MGRITFFVLVFLCFENSNLELRISQREDSSILNDKVVRIVRSRFHSARKMAFRYAKEFEQVTEIIKEIKIPITINADEVALPRGQNKREPSQVVFIMEEMRNVLKHLDTSLWTAETHFIMIAENSNETETLLKDIFQLFKHANVVNIIALVPTSDDVLVYSYIPYSYEECDTVKLITISPDSNEFILGTRFNDLNGCLFHASVVDTPPMIIFPGPETHNGTTNLNGTEVNIVLELSKWLNFTAMFALPKDGKPWGWINPKPQGIVGEVYLKKSHFGFGLLASTLERFEYLDTTISTSPILECLTWAVPIGAAGRQATWIKIYVTEFSPPLWICIVFLFALGTLTFWLVSRAVKELPDTKIVFYMFSTFINVPVKHPHGAVLRSLFLGWIWYSFIIVTSYQSLMGSELTVAYRLKDIDTVKDLLESDLQLTGYINILRLFVNATERDVKIMLNRSVATTYDIEEAIVKIALDKNVAHIRATTSFMYYSLHNPYARGQIHFMKECLYEYYPIMVLQPKSFLTRKANQLIRRLFESGILLKWRHDYIYDVYRPQPSSIRLTLRHMLAPFVVLIFGLGCSIIAFVVEQIHYRVAKRSKLFVD